MNDAFQDLMREATRLTQEGRLQEATATIQRALGDAAAANGLTGNALARLFDVIAQPAEASAGADDSRSIEGVCTHDGATRSYKLHVPARAAGRALPLVVMLHGCTQSVDDFAAGTGMNDLADELGFFVLYPAQSTAANPQGCWNWFEPEHQQRGSGEPALIAAMTRGVIDAHGIDARRVYIAGMSAGGAMADIVGAAYPDIFAAVGVHSGLPGGSAGNTSEAFAVMGSGDPETPAQPVSRTSGDTGRPMQKAVPIIVFHGDRDRMVHPRNGERVVAAALDRVSAGAPKYRAVSARPPRIEKGMSAQGRHYTRTTHDDHEGSPVVEHWLVHDSGHAWSGGRAEGSYTDVQGPDATREMLRFFFAQSRAGD
jgi:poly(hydroxyalkanoate) depolymerase family esterase